MADKAQENPATAEIIGSAGKDLLNKDGSVTQLIEWATQNISSPEEMLDFFEQSGVPVSHGEEITGDYQVVTSEQKAEWCTKHEGERIFCVQWHFYDGVGDSEFAAIHLVSRFGKYILNDGAIGGMKGQLRKVTDNREKDPDAAVRRTSTAGLMVNLGLRRNKPFYYDTRPKSDEKGKEHHGRAIPKLGLDDVEKYPMQYREQAKTTWSFNL